MKFKIVLRNLWLIVKSDFRPLVGVCEALLFAVYMSSVVMMGIVYFGDMTKLINIHGWESTLPYAKYWFIGNLSIAFIYYVWNRLFRAIKNSK